MAHVIVAVLLLLSVLLLGWSITDHIDSCVSEEKQPVDPVKC